ncbi:uncharacterized protein P884DRAFT_303843 [Thermothelomyces heterothallicus CBS 202.75]|uniref:uncharacterized protein n=1 Tax=Thermothelomyces heterothallicus CBS 202.75 TaxID=1149848 RepID=UPI00374494D5
MIHGDTRARTGLTTFLLASSALVWASAIIVMGILAYYVSLDYRGTHLIYSLVIAVLTSAFFPLAFFLVISPGFILLFNLIFSYLWLIVVTFIASDWSSSKNDKLLTVEAFSFIAFFFLFFNIIYDWHYGFFRPDVRRAVV